jgi:hypothetical protein
MNTEYKVATKIMNNILRQMNIIIYLNIMYEE